MNETAKPGPAIARPNGTIALFLPSSNGGGVQRVVLNLAAELQQRGRSVDLVLGDTGGPIQCQVPEGVNVVPLASHGRIRSLARAWHAQSEKRRLLLRPVALPVRGPAAVKLLGGLAEYLRSARPSVLLSSKPHANLTAIWARSLADTDTRIAIWEHAPLSCDMTGAKRRKWRWHYLRPLVRDVYPHADTIIAVSNGVAEDLARIGIDRARIHTIYNPVVSQRVSEAAAASLDHPWFSETAPPVVLSVSRITESKDLSTLLRAFARVRANRASRLMILGEAKAPRDKRRLTKLASELKVRDSVAFTGFVDNPFAYMARARVLVCSSKWEGFGNVLVEALACGCPVVSTNCPTGPVEILQDGRFGRLVPVGDDAAMGEAILRTMDEDRCAARLQQHANHFSVAHATDRFLDLFEPG